MIVTRPHAAALHTAKRVAALGWRPVIAPCLDIHHIPIQMPDQPVQAVIVASANALPSLPEGLHDVTLLAVGDATAARACDLGWRKALSADGDAYALARLARQRLRPGDGTVLLANGAGEGDRLAMLLAADGFSVIRRDAYAAIRPISFPQDAAAALNADTVRSILFFSAHTAEVFMTLLPDDTADRLQRVEALAVSEAAAAKLRRMRWHKIRVAIRPREDRLLAMLDERSGQ